MKKISVRKTETLKTTSALYGCGGCPELCAFAAMVGLGSYFGV